MTGKARKRKQSRIPRKSSSAPITMAATPWDQGADGPANRIGLVDQERGEVDLATGKVINPNRVFGKRRMPMVERMHRQGRLTREHVAAAQRLYAAYAGQPSRDPLAAILDRVDGGGCDDPNVAQIDGKREFFDLKAMVPAKCWPVVEHVVIEDRPIRDMVGGTNPETFAEHLARLAMGLETIR